MYIERCMNCIRAFHPAWICEFVFPRLCAAQCYTVGLCRPAPELAMPPGRLSETPQLLWKEEASLFMIFAAQGACQVQLSPKNAVKTAFFSHNRATSLCPVVNVSADFCQAGMLSEKLTEAGFDSQASAVFLIEGVLDFLEEQAEPFLTEVLGPLAAPGSLAIINYAIGPQRPGTFTSTKLKQLLEGLGWQNLQISVFGDERLNYGRYKEGLAPSEDWAFATCVKGAVGPTPEAQEQ